MYKSIFNCILSTSEQNITWFCFIPCNSILSYIRHVLQMKCIYLSALWLLAHLFDILPQVSSGGHVNEYPEPILHHQRNMNAEFLGSSSSRCRILWKQGWTSLCFFFFFFFFGRTSSPPRNIGGQQSREKHQKEPQRTHVEMKIQE